MIGTEGQYLYQFTVGDREDFIQEEDLISFLLVEEAGNVLPSFELGFTTKDEKILSYLNEGNSLKITFGRTKDNLIDVSLSVLYLETNKGGESKYMIELKGLLSSLPYVSVGKINIFESLSGVEVINQIASNYFIPTFGITKSSDSQNWIQANIPDKKFVNDVWMHSYMADSFIGIGISSDGKFILKDMKALVSEESLYKFTTNPEKTKDVYYDGDYKVVSKTGFFNHWVGYGRQKHVFNLEDGTESDSLESTESLLALTNTLSRTSDISKRIAEVGVIGDNVHVNYWKAYLRNLQSLAIFSSSSISFSFHGRYIPIRVLDLVMFIEDELNHKQANEHYSGKYFVTNVARNIANRQFATTVRLSRESFGAIRGDLR